MADSPTFAVHSHGDAEANLRQALAEARLWRSTHPEAIGPVVIELGPGVYRLRSSLRFTEADGGLVLRAAKAGTVELRGCTPVADFKPVGDGAALARLSAAARGRVVVCDLAAVGIESIEPFPIMGFQAYDQLAPMELLVADRPMTLARWPNVGYDSIAGFPDGRVGDRFAKPVKPAEFHYAGDRPARWTQAKDLRLFGYWGWDWAEHYLPVQSIDVARRLIQFPPGSPVEFFGMHQGQRWCAINLLEELDVEGEYYIERDTGLLYFLPPEGIDWDSLRLTMLAGPLLECDGAASVRFEGLTLTGTRGDGVAIHGGRGVEVVGCTIRAVGGAGVTIASGSDHAVIDCDISLTGQGGVMLGGGDRDTLTPARNRVENCHIHDLSRWVRCYRTPVVLTGVGNIVRHNRIHRVTHTGILVKGNDHLIEGNDISDATLETADGGPIYVGGEYNAIVTDQGAVIRRNYLHDGDACTGDPLHHNGVYCDNMQSGVTAEGNLIARLPLGLVSGFGHANSFRYNVIIDCQRSAMVSSVETTHTWGPELRELNWARDYIKPVLTGYLADKPVYFERYPILHQLKSYVESDQEASATKVVVARNVLVRSPDVETLSLDASRNTIADNFVTEDPGFRDPAAGDYRFVEGSPVLAMGIPQPPLLSEIGLQISPRRTQLPLSATVRGAIAVEQPARIGLGVDGAPAKVRVRLSNIGNAPAYGVLRLWVGPTACGDERAMPSWDYTLEPGQTDQRVLDVPVTAASPVLCVGEARDGEFFSRRIVPLPAGVETRWPILLNDDDAAMSQYELRRHGHAVATLRLGWRGDRLAFDLRVRDARVVRAANFWEGSCAQLYLAADPKGPVRQVVFLPPADGYETQIRFHESGAPVAEPHGILAHFETAADGYRVTGSIPAASLRLRPGQACAFEADVVAADGSGEHRLTALFDSVGAYHDASRFCRVLPVSD